MKISKKLKVLIILFMCGTTFFIYKYTNYNNITYTVLGDGLSCGIDSYGRKTYSYGDYVKDYLTDKNKLKDYYKEYTKQDMTIEMLHNTLLTNQKKEYKYTNKNIKEILRETDYLTMSIGINDLLYLLTTTNELSEAKIDEIISEIEIKFNNLIQEIRKVYNREIYIIGYYDLNINNKLYKTAIKKLNNIYKKNNNVTYISTYIISENKNIFLSNSMNYYPNYKGYQVIASKIIDKISKKLEK